MVRLKKFVPITIKRFIKLLFTSSKNSKWEQFVSKEHMNVLVFLGGFYQNLGDMAITYAQSEFLKAIYPNANVILVPSMETYTAVKVLRNLVNDIDLITITGGGNMDYSYSSLEDARLHVIKSFPRNRIICFPQTITYSSSKHEMKKLKANCLIYNQHPNLYLFAREIESYKKMKALFYNANVGCCPDIVLSLNKRFPRNERSIILSCLRSDKEKNVSDILKNELLDYLNKEFINLKCVDTVDVNIEDCSLEKYEKTLEQFWTLIKESKLVITDRLHCMIFCVITGTPCIALDNSNHKILRVYETWLSGISYVKFMYDCNCDEIIESINSLLTTPIENQIVDFLQQFDDLRKACYINDKL